MKFSVKTETVCCQSTCITRNDKENSSSLKQMIPEEKSNLQEGIKGIRNNKYLDKYKSCFLLLIFLNAYDGLRKNYNIVLQGL